MKREIRVFLSIGCFGLVAVGAFELSRRGVYGWTLFVLLPMIAGAMGTWSVRPATPRAAAVAGGVIGASGCALFLLIGLEGWMCALMALPLVVPLTISGSLIAFQAGAWSRGKHPAVLGLLVPISMFFDVNAKPPVYAVTTSIVVNAAPEVVWKSVIAFPDITDRPDWVLRTGMAYPIRTRIGGTGVGVPRSCDLSTGTVQERVVVWDEPRVLRFVVTATPPAMREMGLYGPISPKHLNGYYISKEGQFELTPLPGGKTLLVGTSWYQHGLWPAEYWRWWSDTVVHHIHARVLEHVKALAEKRG